MNFLSKTFLAVSALFVSVGMMAQEDPSKESVIVDPFTCSEGIPAMAGDNVRSAVMSGFTNVGRFYVIDALTDSRLSGLYADRKIEDVVNDANWKTESETAYKALGVEKLVKGQVEFLSTYTKKDEEGNITYYCDMNFNLSVYNINDGSVIGSKGYKYHKLSVVSCDDAFSDAVKNVTRDMTAFVNDFFAFETYILELGEADKKGAIKTLWISGGTEMGISKGTVFDVKAEQKIGPKVTLTEIGKIVAKEVSDGVTLCNVRNKKEGDAIKTAFSDGKKLVITLSHKRDIIGGVENFLGL